jgi:exodeoxyribonuclease VII small subunit
MNPQSTDVPLGNTEPAAMPRAWQQPLPSDWRYEATVDEIEAILARIETGELELAEVFDQFSQAVTHLHECEAFLQQRQQQMHLLIETLGNDPEF